MAPGSEPACIPAWTGWTASRSGARPILRSRAPSSPSRPQRSIPKLFQSSGNTPRRPDALESTARRRDVAASVDFESVV
eukprot:scaffold86_cov338-Pavlova_lutheri.AAC.102